MSPQMGRPKIENPKKNDIKVRIDDQTLELLDEYCNAHGLTRAETIRQGILLLLAQQK